MKSFTFIGQFLFTRSSKKEKYAWQLMFWSGWILLVLFLAYFITGYGMTKGLFDKELATMWHQEYLPVPAIIIFVIHSLLGARILLRRHQLHKSKSIQYLTILIFLVILIVLLYFQFS